MYTRIIDEKPCHIAVIPDDTFGLNPYRPRRTTRISRPPMASTGRSRQSRPSHSDITADTDFARSHFAFDHDTTASVRSAERSQHQPPALDADRDRKEPKPGTRALVKRRVLKVSLVFRPTTEEELDEVLLVDKLKEMKSLTKTEIDIPPTYDHPQLDGFDIKRHVCAVCAGQMLAKPSMPKRGMRRVISLLPWGGYKEDEVLRVSDLAAMDEHIAVKLFLQKIHGCRKEMFTSVQDSGDRRNLS